jgi:hypothetical protein
VATGEGGVDSQEETTVVGEAIEVAAAEDRDGVGDVVEAHEGRRWVRL